jgi:hypothetical protein
MSGVMPEENHLTLWQVDQARTDFTAIEEKLDFIKAQLGRLHTRKEQASLTLLAMITGAALVLVRIESLLR